jgi:hypothetical protein
MDPERGQHSSPVVIDIEIIPGKVIKSVRKIELEKHEVNKELINTLFDKAIEEILKCVVRSICTGFCPECPVFERWINLHQIANSKTLLLELCKDENQ